MSGTESVDVVIVGGGVSGLAAAKRLLDAKCAQKEPLKVVILEARDRLGGRIHTVSWDDLASSEQYTKRETALDLGASFVHGVSKRNPLLQVCDEVGGPPFQIRVRCGLPDTVDHSL
ncbi:hypothetical protein L7F22_029686 [Adiantum nelumboides]|nr:hypothetical protein [Adiantum nelumboides]